MDTVSFSSIFISIFSIYLLFQIGVKKELLNLLYKWKLVDIEMINKIRYVKKGKKKFKPLTLLLPNHHDVNKSKNIFIDCYLGVNKNTMTF